MSYDKKIRLVLYNKKYIFEDLVISPNSVQKYVKDKEEINKQIFKFNKRGCNAYFASAYINEITKSTDFLFSAASFLIKFYKSKHLDENIVILMKLQTPKYQFLDFKWNERINNMIVERQNIEYALSWLSTLGGAFSALGDTFEHCAEMAGKISLKQFKLAIQLGDPSIVARCKLYAVLSLIQRDYLHYPKVILIQVFNFAKETNDIRLQKMCQGIWAKLQYHRHLRKQTKVKYTQNVKNIIKLENNRFHSK